MESFESQFYPFEKVYTGFNTFSGAEKIPLKILTFLLDLPDGNGYEPTDRNDRARVRLAKYLWYDGGNPLSNALPTPQQKLSMLFDGNEPVLNADELKEKHPQGYRLFPQEYWGQAQLTAKTVLKCYLGKIIPANETKAVIGLDFEVWCNVNHQNTTKTAAYERAYNIEQCVVEALNGVDIGGVGCVRFSRAMHYECGSRPIRDEGTNVGRAFTLALEWQEDTHNKI